MMDVYSINMQGKLIVFFTVVMQLNTFFHIIDFPIIRNVVQI